MPKIIRPTTPRREKIDAVAKIIKRVCGLSQSEAFNIAKEACVFTVPKRSVSGKYAGKEN
jgi:hypothetical protein